MDRAPPPPPAPSTSSIHPQALGSRCLIPRLLPPWQVFDGHCGHECAEFLAERLPAALGEMGEAAGELGGGTGVRKDPSGALREALLRADLAFRAEVGESEECDAASSGSTALLAAVLEGGGGRPRVVLANVGDSRAVACSSGIARDLTVDHSPEAPAELARIRAAGGFVEDGYVNGQLNVARALGNWALDIKRGEEDAPGPLTAEPDVLDHAVEEGEEFMLLASDGLWEVFTSQSAVDFAREHLRSHNDPRGCSEALIGEALRRGTTDNVSVVVLCFLDKIPPRRAAAPPRDGLQRTLSAGAISTLSRTLSDALSAESPSELPPLQE